MAIELSIDYVLFPAGDSHTFETGQIRTVFSGTEGYLIASVPMPSETNTGMKERSTSHHKTAITTSEKSETMLQS